MRYYIRPNRESGIEGPYAVDELNELLSNRELNRDSLATSDLGEPREILALGRECDWFSIRRIPGTPIFERTLPPRPKRMPRRPSWWLALAMALASFVSAQGMEQTVLKVALWISTVGWLAEGITASPLYKRLFSQEGRAA